MFCKCLNGKCQVIEKVVNKKSGLAIVFVCLVLFAGSGLADWPQFAGPNQNAISAEKDLMKQWPDAGPEVLWRVEVGKGFGGVAIESGKVYILDRVTGKKDVLRCIDLLTGKEDWRFGYEAPGKIDRPGSRSHPAVDKKYVFILGPFGDLHCISKKTHKPLWKNNILQDFGGKQPRWAFTQTPALYENIVILAPIGSKAGVVAFKKDSGEIAWQSKPLDGGIGYASPILTKIDGIDQVIVITTKQTVGIEAKSGKVLWSNGDWRCKIPIASALPIGDGRVFVTGGYGAGAAMFKVEKKDGEFHCTTLYKTTECNCQIQQPLLYNGHLYLNGNDKSFRYGMICMDLDGNVKWKTGKSPGFDWGGLLLADDMIYAVDGTKGDLCMIKPQTSGYKEVGRVNLLSGLKIWGTIAITDGKILLRDQSQLKCVDVRGK